LKVIKHELRQSTERVWETWTVRGQGNAGGGWNYPKGVHGGDAMRQAHHQSQTATSLKMEFGFDGAVGVMNMKVEKHKKGGLNCVFRIKTFSK
jgi:hypothetical protein